MNIEAGSVSMRLGKKNQIKSHPIARSRWTSENDGRRKNGFFLTVEREKRAKLELHLFPSDVLL